MPRENTVRVAVQNGGTGTANDLRVDVVTIALKPVPKSRLDNALLRKRFDVIERPFHGRTTQNTGERFA